MRSSIGKITIYCLAGLFVLAAAAATAPPTVSYQGRLVDASDAPLTGTFDLTFNLYDVSSGGSALWTESHSGVSVDNGLFEVQLGSNNPLDASLFDGDDRWLGVTVSGDAEMTPRTKLASVPFALRTETVDGATGGTIVGNVTVDGDLTVTGSTGSSIDTAYLTINPAAYEATQNLSLTNFSTLEVTADNNFTSINLIAPVTLPDSATILDVTVFVRDEYSERDISAAFGYSDTSLSFASFGFQSTSGTPGVTSLNLFGGSLVVNNEAQAHWVRVTWLSPTDGDPAIMGAGMIRVKYAIEKP